MKAWSVFSNLISAITTQLKLFEEEVSDVDDAELGRRLYPSNTPAAARRGKKVLVDYAGLTIRVVDYRTEEVLFEAAVFVAVLGASNYCLCRGYSITNIIGLVAQPCS